MKKISFIIINYNGKRFLKRLFESIRFQTFRDFEVIFVDNGSDDGSTNFVKENFPNAKIIQSENNGYGVGCNSGARLAKGEFLIFLNEDMYLPEDFLEKMIKFRNKLSCQEKIGAISCKMVDFNKKADDFPPTYGARIDFMGFPIKNKSAGKTLVVSGSPFFISRDLFEKSGGFNEMIFIYGEDVDLSWRLFLLGYKNFTINETFIYHFGGAATGRLGAKKIADVVYGAFISIYTNFKTATFIFAFLPFVVFMLIFYLGLTFRKMEIGYLSEIVKKFRLFFVNIKRARRIKKFVKKNRVRGDLSVFRYISFVPAFIANKSIEKFNPEYAVKNF